MKGVPTGRVGEALFRILISERAPAYGRPVYLALAASSPSLSGAMLLALARSLQSSCVYGWLVVPSVARCSNLHGC